MMNEKEEEADRETAPWRPFTTAKLQTVKRKVGEP